MKIMMLALALTLLLVLRISPVAAQSPETRTGLGGGAGVAAPVEEGPDADLANALSLNLSHQRGAHVFSLRAAAAFELFGDDCFDVGLLYRRALSSGALFASAGAGLGVVFGTRGAGGIFDGENGESVGPTIGIPLETQAFVRLLPLLGIGAYGFANLNRERRLLGATLAVQVGVLR